MRGTGYLEAFGRPAIRSGDRDFLQ